MGNKDNTRLTNYYLIRRRREEEEQLPWVRPEEVKGLHLPHPIILINGAFDVLHFGHMKIIALARKQAGEGGVVVCAMDGDERVRERKGEGRPILTWIERATTLAYMPIDYLVEITTDRDMKRLVGALQPDLRIQGYDYAGKVSAFPHIPKAFVKDDGMRTSEIIRRCQNAARGY